MEIQLKDLIFEYQRFNNKNALTELLNYFEEITYNIAKKLSYEEANTDMIIALIETVNKLNLNKYTNNSAIRAILIHSLINKRTDFFRKYVLTAHEEVEINLDVLSVSKFNDDSNLIIEDLIKNLSTKQKQVIRLSFIQQYSDTEIAKLMHTSRQAINQLKKRALNLLKVYV